MTDPRKHIEEERGKNIFLRIRRKMSTFSTAQKKIAEFILYRCSDVVKMSSRDLARELNISPSTIVRFAVELGFSGFKKMMNDLQTTVFVYSQTPLKKVHDSISENEPLENILQKVISYGVENLSERKFSPLNDTFMKVVSVMIRAEKIYLVGARSSYCIVHFGGYYLSSVGKNVQYFSSSQEDRYERLNELTKRDMVISVSFHRYYKDTVSITSFAKEKKAFVVGITDSILSPIANYCDEVLLVPNTSPYSSYLPAMVIMEALILAFIQARGSRAKKLLEERMDVLLRNGVYANVEE